MGDNENESDRQSKAVTITLSLTTHEELDEVAKYLKKPLARLIAEYVSEAHRNPAFASLLRRSRESK